MLLAILLPFLSFMVRGKVLTGIICLILQITLIGWLPAAIWAVLSLNNARADQRNDKLIKQCGKINARRMICN
ncbi:MULTISPECIES: YqaE/Pmp3 family membrane protein [unclassified Chryseobacterium]|uniref:YqaE/Pmp3 family membrane protein n=1 Tax=unclassified Chryseobacterium TaxID=2593645 RepID=UPI002853168A|nr:YqaE/Pmp3 family membrane protein [Chryseobacterium sp. CFS7]MDR4893185.1 YqaE/Pmp3 family membrane protein [Chryseobacterium sp. CFS7]